MNFGSELSKSAEIKTEAGPGIDSKSLDTSFDPDHRTEIKNGSDMDGLDGNIDQNPETFDPDKRVDVNNDGRPDAIQDAPFNPDKRIGEQENITAPQDNTREIENESLKPSASERDLRQDNGENLENILKEYVDDLRTKSECPETISDEFIHPESLVIRPPEETAQLRSEFNKEKAQLIEAWEKENGREWPVYDHDIKNSEGDIIKKAGWKYDAHHVQPLSLGGLNQASNITPLRFDLHREVHAKGSPCDRLEKAI